MKQVIRSLLLIAVCALFTAGSQALPTHDSETFYYSDDTFTEVVGYRYIGCNGGNQHWGITPTQWYERYSTSCDSGSSSCERCAVDMNGVTHCDDICSTH